jgi:HTH-type transcriptional regulator / antitoxin HigA
MTDTNLRYQPAVVSPPGATLDELIEERGITQAELARRMGRPLNAVNEIVLGNKEITEDTALELERVLGTPAHFWLARESRYREYLARQRDAGRAENRLDWLDTLPLKHLQALGKLPAGRLTAAFKTQLIEPALQFFGVASPEGWQEQYGRVQAAFRRANPAKQTDNVAITAWLRLGEIEAAKADLPAFNAELLQSQLPAMRALSMQNASAISNGLKDRCAQSGVLLLLVPAMPGTHVSGVARWLGERPVIQLSLLHKWNDIFWFSFFHEVAHILKHPKKAVFLDDASAGDTTQTKEEQEANQFAANVLISPADRKLLGNLDLNHASIHAFARSIGVHAGIVVGALQHAGFLDYGHPLNKLRERYEIKAS